MPTKRRVLIFLVILVLMLLVKHAASEPMQWRGPDAADSEAIEHAVYVLMSGGILFGIIAGGGRALANRRRMKKEGYFTGDLTMISLSKSEEKKVRCDHS